MAMNGWRSTLAGLMIATGGFGCGGKPGDAPTVSIPGPPDATADSAPANADARLSQPFAEAAVQERATGDILPPPDRTLAGQSTGKLRVEVQKLWDQIAFASPAGKRIDYTADLDTEFGTIRLTFRPDVAPNHVRNFIALARAGYYDGLVFEHVIQQQGEGGPDARLDLIEGGCPLGTGEPGIGHLGYWLRPEISEAVKHEAGAVGACRDAQPDTAACRFYITLSAAPVMDGNFTVFGKVASGLDVVRRITEQPRPNGSIRPDKPTVIRTVTIRAKEVDESPAGGQN
jgi:peptidyl-prolyl cis-trans isomerase B (cyclophilin B)